MQNYAKDLKNYWNPSTWLLTGECSVRASPWIPTWQGLDGFQKSLLLCALDECWKLYLINLSIVQIKFKISLLIKKSQQTFQTTLGLGGGGGGGYQPTKTVYIKRAARSDLSKHVASCYGFRHHSNLSSYTHDLDTIPMTSGVFITIQTPYMASGVPGISSSEINKL